MSVTSSQQLIQAAADPHLQERLIALLAANGHTNPEAVVRQRMGELVAGDVEGGQSIAFIYGYAVDTYPPPPGKNPGAVRDDHLVTALRNLGLITDPEGA